MHTIGKIVFNFRMEEEEKARRFYGKWDSFFSQSVEKVTVRVLERLSFPAGNLQVDGLEIDMGTIPEEELETLFPVQWEEKLEDALRKLIQDPPSSQVILLSEKERLFQFLSHFLLHGVFPWHAEPVWKNINYLFLKVLEEQPGTLKTFLMAYGHYTGLRLRLVYQLDDPELEKGIRLLAPRESVFICSYIYLLRIRYPLIVRPEIRETDYRNAVWLVVYSYLMTRYGSWFDKKSFLQTTIHQLAGRYNLSYESLLSLLIGELRHSKTDRYFSVELFRLLNQLGRSCRKKI